MHLDYKTTFLVINFLLLMHPEKILKEFIPAHHKENEDQSHQLQGQGLSTRDDKQERGTIPMPTFAGRPSTMSSLEFYGWTAKTADIGAAIRHILQASIILGLEDSIQQSSVHLFRFSIGSKLTDQRSGDHRFIG